MSAAAVGGAGTASLNVPRLASDADADAAAPVVVLQLLFTPSVVDVVGGVVSSRTAATEVERQIAVTHVHAQGLSDADSTARLAGLRAGTIAGATKREVAYAALFERTRAAQQRIVAAIAADATPMAPLPTADEARAGPTLPVANVAAALRVDAAAVASGCRATVEALGAAAGTGRLLAAAYDGLDWGTDAIVARLRLLALRGVDGLTTPPTATEREYAAHFAPARTLRRLVSETLASVTAAAPAPAASTAEAAVAVDSEAALVYEHFGGRNGFVLARVRCSDLKDSGAAADVLLPLTALACDVLEAVLQAVAAPSLGLPPGVDRSNLRVLIASSRAGSTWRLLAGGIPLSFVCPIDASTGQVEPVQIQIEVRRDDGRWTLGACFAPGLKPLPSGVTPLAWRSTLAKGSYVDAQDCGGMWYNARIVDVLPATGEGPASLAGATLSSPVLAVVHFRGWSARFDERIELPSLWHRLMPLYERVAPWRQGLRPGDSLEVKDERVWFGGVVESLDFTRLPPRVCVIYHTCKAGQPLTAAVRKTFDLEEDDAFDSIGAHLKRADRAATIRPAGAPAQPAVAPWVTASAPTPPLAKVTVEWAQTPRQVVAVGGARAAEAAAGASW